MNGFHKLLVVLAALVAGSVLLLAGNGAEAQLLGDQSFIPRSAAAGSGLSLDATSTGGAAVNTGAGPFTDSITTTHAPDKICIAYTLVDGDDSAATVTSAHLTFTRRGSSNHSSGTDISEFCAPASATLSSETISVNMNGCCTSIESNWVTWAVYDGGATPSFDSNAAIPTMLGAGAGDNSITTTSTKTFAVCMYKMDANGISWGAGSGWTLIYGASTGALVVEYKLFSSAQTGTVCTTAQHTHETSSIADAIAQ